MGQAELQIGFYKFLKEIKKQYLKEALKETVSKIDISILNKESDLYYSKNVLQKIASYGLRSEVLLPLPYLLSSNPRLISYYRLLFGLSQKEFYSTSVFGRFRSIEEGKIPKNIKDESFKDLVNHLKPIAEEFVLGIDELSIDIVHELQLLTLGPQLRGGRNTILGKEATERTFQLLKSIVSKYIIETDSRSIRIFNSLDQNVIIQFASDPDIVIIESLPNGNHKIVSIEIKGGTDYSNAHNRLGEAEKSHQKAKQDGFFEFWTIVRVDINKDLAKKESPTTTKFFNLDKIEDSTTIESVEFKEVLASRLKIKI